jgi:CheY-like chemotaxis protein
MTASRAISMRLREGATMAQQLAARAPHRSVMVVEDDGVIRGLLSIAMEDEGFEVSTAIDGQDALEKLHGVLPNVIVTDLQMPRVNGWQFVNALRREPRTRNISVIVVSAQLGQLTAEDLHVQGCMSKPFNLDTLFALLDEVLRDLDTTAAAQSR